MNKIIPNIELYPHNQETYKRICEMWKTTNRVAAIQATGTGKTFLMLKCLFDYPDDNKIVLAPSNYILDQLTEKSEGQLNNTELMTYAKLSRMSGDEIELLDIKMIVLDEFHRCGAEQWGGGVQNLLELFPDAKVLGTSATPIRFLDGQRDMSDELFDGNVAVNLSLTEAIVRGILPMPKYISALYTFDEEANRLKERIGKSHNNEDSKKELLKKLELLKRNLDRSKGIPSIFERHVGGSGGKFIVFCKDRVHLYEMKDTVAEWFKKARIGNKVKTYVVLSDLSQSDEEFKRFIDSDKNDIVNILFSVDMLNEGIHAEDISGVILLRPTTSPIIYYQQIGRAIQVGGSDHPLIFDFVNNFSNIESRTFLSDLSHAFQDRNMANKSRGFYENNLNNLDEFLVIDEARDVLSLFESIEDALIDNWTTMLASLKEYKTKYGNCLVPQDYVVNGVKLGYLVRMYAWNYKNNAVSSEKIRLLNDIGFIWDRIDEKWLKQFSMLREYKNKYGHCNVPQGFVEDKIKLGSWLKTQRILYNKNKLSTDRVELLDSLNLVWNRRNNQIEDYWNEMFQTLIEFRCEFGSVMVPYNLIYKDKNLGNWVMRQRTIYKKGNLEKQKEDRLNEIEFIWNVHE